MPDMPVNRIFRSLYFLKKNIFILLVTTFLYVLVGCSSQKDSSSNIDSREQQSKQQNMISDDIPNLQTSDLKNSYSIIEDKEKIEPSHNIVQTLSTSIPIEAIKPAHIPQNKTVSSSSLFTEVELNSIHNPDYYFINTFDVNADGKEDKLFHLKYFNYIKSNKKLDIDTYNTMDRIIVYKNSGSGNYQHVLSTYDFSTDGGFRATESLMPRSSNLGFIISTYFPDRGIAYKDYYLSLISGSWIIDKIVHHGVMGLIPTTPEYNCLFNTNFNLPYEYNEHAHNYTDEEIIKNCPPNQSTYIVKSSKAIILNEDFKSYNPPNYYIKNDIIEAIYQNEEWVKVSYKDDTKIGWINKTDLK